MRACCLLVALAACGSGEVRREGPPAGGYQFEWGVSQQLWGAESFTIEASGAAHYHFESARGKPAIDRRRTLSAADLEPLRAAVRVPAFCALRSDRDGIPDEGRPTLAVRDGVRCTITLWDGEWEEMPAARPALDAIKRLIQRMKSG